jgi:hypothetical protein
VSVELGMQYAMRMRYIVICGLSGFTVYFSSRIFYVAEHAEMILK